MAAMPVAVLSVANVKIRITNVSRRVFALAQTGRFFQEPD